MAEEVEEEVEVEAGVAEVGGVKAVLLNVQATTNALKNVRALV